MIEAITLESKVFYKLLEEIVAKEDKRSLEHLNWKDEAAKYKLGFYAGHLLFGKDKKSAALLETIKNISARDSDPDCYRGIKHGIKEKEKIIARLNQLNRIEKDQTKDNELER